MLVKSADDKSKRLTLLESLTESPLLEREQKKWVDAQLWALRMGIAGERDAAFYIDSDFKDSLYHAVLHDLRFVIDGEVVQIDHLIIARGFVFYLLETKNFNGDLIINEHGEFSVRYKGGNVQGIPSPLEQSRRHEKPLGKLLERLGIVGRVNSKPDFRHVVLVHPKGNIQRPKAGFDSSNVIKADQFMAWREQYVEKKLGLLQMGASMLNMRSADTVREWAEMLVRQHRAVDPLHLPDLMKPRLALAPVKTASVQPAKPVCVTCNAPVSDAEANYCRSNARQFDGGIYCREHQRNAQAARVQAELAVSQAVSAPEPEASEERKRRICATCGNKITFEEGRFCWSRPQRFGGLQYCREHQAAFK